jgi:flagellar hook assembly protein FlgD
VSIKIYDLNGRLIRDYPRYLYYAGENQVYWDTKDNYGHYVASGVYLYQVSTREMTDQKKMLLVK